MVCPGQQNGSQKVQNGIISSLLMLKMLTHSCKLSPSPCRYSVLGWCNGGVSGLILASLYPETVNKLVVWGANAYLMKEDIDNYEKVQDIETWNPKRKEIFVKEYGSSFQDLWSNWLDCTKRICRERKGDLCKKELSKITCPTLIFHGAKDHFVPSFHPRYLRDHVTGSRLVEMEEGKHDLHMSCHQDFNTTVEKFIKTS